MGADLRLTDPEAAALGVPELQRRLWRAADEIDQLRAGDGITAVPTAEIERLRAHFETFTRYTPESVLLEDIGVLRIGVQVLTIAIGVFLETVKDWEF